MRILSVRHKLTSSSSFLLQPYRLSRKNYSPSLFRNSSKVFGLNFSIVNKRLIGINNNNNNNNGRRFFCSNNNNDSSSLSSSLSSSSSSSSKRFGLRKILKVQLYTLGGIGLLFAAIAAWDKDWKRSMYFWSQLYPIYVHYRLVDLYTKFMKMDSETRTKHFTPLHERYADKIYNTAIYLKGFYLKICQMGSARTDIIPEQWVEKLRLLEDSCPPEDFKYICDIICKQYGIKDVHEIFDYIKPTPLGSASIGQAHYAILKNGREVVIKVQYPNIEETFRGDFIMARRFCKMAQPAHLPFLDETEKQFLTEFNYTLEAKNLEEIADNLNNHPYWKDKVVVPNPVKHLCTEKCLVMDYLRGEKLISALKRNFNEVATSRGQTVQQFLEEQKKKTPPTSRQLQFYRVQVRIRDFFWNMLATTTNYTFGMLFWLLGNPNQNIVVSYKHTPIPLNIKYILDVVNDVHGYEVLIDGAFNGDPHPGNILLMPDGRIGLIDYGQVKHLNEHQRIELAKMLTYLSDNRDELVWKELLKMGFRSKKLDGYVLLKTARLFFDCDALHITEGINAQLFLEYLNKRDPLTVMIDDYVMSGRLRLLLSGLHYSLGYTLSAAHDWRKWSDQLLRKYNIDPYAPEHLPKIDPELEKLVDFSKMEFDG